MYISRPARKHRRVTVVGDEFIDGLARDNGHVDVFLGGDAGDAAPAAGVRICGSTGTETTAVDVVTVGGL